MMVNSSNQYGMQKMEKLRGESLLRLENHTLLKLSFWHAFRSFERLWTFFIIALQAMIIITWKDVSLTNILSKNILYNVSSVFITAAFLCFLQSTHNIRKKIQTENFFCNLIKFRLVTFE